MRTARTQSLAISPFGGVNFDLIQEFSTLALLRAFSVRGLSGGEKVSVSGDVYYFDPSAVADDDNSEIIKPAVGSGRWLNIVGASADTIDNVALLRASDFSDLAHGATVTLSCYSVTGDGYGGQLNVDRVTPGVDNGFDIFVSRDGTVFRRPADTFVNVKLAGAYNDGTHSAETTNAIQSVMDNVHAQGGGIVFIPAGTYACGSLFLRDGVHLKGASRNSTVIKLADGTDADLLAKKPGDVGSYARISDIYFDGNDANNTVGSIYWVGSSGLRGATLTMERVYITKFRRGAVSGNAAVSVSGADWVVFRDVDIFANPNAGGIIIQVSDSVFKNLYVADCGGASGDPGVNLLQCNSNKFIGCYFGGSLGNDQVKLQGAQYNAFSACTNDGAWFAGYRLTDSGGVPSSYNQWVGGTCTNCSRAADNSDDNFNIGGAAAYNTIVGVHIGNDTVVGVNKGRYGVVEGGTAAHNTITGCTFHTFGTGPFLLNTAGGSKVSNSPGANPVGIADLVVGASPFTVTNATGASQSVYVKDGTVSSIVKNTKTLSSVTNVSFQLEPGESAIITYSAAPTITTDTH